MKVIILDDDKFLLDLYLSKFKNAGVEAEAYDSGEKLLKRLKEGEKSDLILLDIIIPGMTGLDTLTEIRKQKLIPEAKVVMLTNQGEGEDMEKAKSLGVDGYIIKASATPSEVVEQALAIVNKN